MPRSQGDALFQCWADFDSYLMENVVPFAPYLFDNSVDIISDNVINYSFDQFAGLAAFDQHGGCEQGLRGGCTAEGWRHDREGVTARGPFPSALEPRKTGSETQNHGRWNEWEGT